MAAVEHAGKRVEGVAVEERRLRPAGHAVVIVATALLVAALLGARGLRKTATIQEPGVRRDLALAVSRPLEGLTHAVLLDRPRALLKEALGRTDDDRVATAILLPREPPRHKATQRPRRPPALPTPVVTRAHPLHVWIVGDSLAVAPGYSLTRLGASLPLEILPVEGRVSTGLERPDVYDWFARIGEVAPQLRGGVAVLVFGGNDDHSYMTGLPAGTSIGVFGTRSWIHEYARRVGGVMDELRRAGAHIVWIGLPITRDSARNARYELLNRISADAASRRKPWVAYVDTYRLLADAHDHYADYRATGRGQLVRLRAPDGIHYEEAGADLVAQRVIDALRRSFRFRR